MKFHSILAAGLLMLCVAAPTVSLAQDWQTPCIAAPYDYSYTDDARQVLIDRYKADGITYFIADVQISDPHELRAVIACESGGGQRRVDGKHQPKGADQHRHNAQQFKIRLPLTSCSHAPCHFFPQSLSLFVCHSSSYFL